VDVLPHLTPRETEVLRLIGRFKSSKQIAALLGVSEKTIESHRSNLFDKLKCESVVELAYYALRYGLAEL
jgi:two-component system nitrate/nitrite response regulator NarL